MKKKSLIFPIIMLVLSMISGMFLLVFTTDFVFDFYANREDIESLIKKAPVLELSYKINPTVQTMYSLSEVYNAYHAVQFTGDEVKVEAVPDGFYEKCVRYQKLVYDYVNSDSYKHLKTDSDPFAPIHPVEYNEKVMVGKDYALALYMSNQKEEAKRIIGNIINDTDNENDKKYIWLRSYFYIVCEFEKDEDYLNWLEETESKITALQEQNTNQSY